MTRQYSSENHLVKLTQTWTGSILLMGAILFPVLEFMDYFVLPEKFALFMTYRLVISACLLFLYYLNGLKRSTAYQYGISIAGVALSAITVELAVLQSGGQNSTYYAAMMILAICALGFVPISMSFAFVLVGIIYSVYAVPILLTETVRSGVFVSNNAFLISTFVIGLLLRYQNQKLIVAELKMRDELSQERDKLERRSSSLEGQITEKTGALAITEQKYRSLFDHANDGIAVLDTFGNLSDANNRFCEIHGFDHNAVLGANVRLLEIEDREGELEDRLRRILGGESLVYEAEHYRRDGSRIFLEISARAIDIGGVPYVQAFYRDITEKIKLREQVLQSQKMESMGVLAGGIAHDFNNTLTAILSHTEVLRRQARGDEFAKRSIKTIEDAARRAGQMVSKLLRFARKESLELVPTELNAVVTDTVELLGRALINRNIIARVSLDRNLPLIPGDSIHLEQVIANLFMNAMDAMPRGGVVTIETVVRELRADAANSYPFLPEGAYVALIVRDTGTGMPREIMDRIFDPFFTTKPAGKGTGLGLAMVYGIVKSHHGEIRVHAKEDEGTTFEIYIPVPARPAVVAPQKSANAATASSARSALILAVDDDLDVLSLIKETLEEHGYSVIAADTPEYALDLFRTISTEIALVITDIVMPVMNGAELSHILKEIRPDLKVIGISGYEKDAIAKELKQIDFFLKKPFDGAQLCAGVRRVLHADVDGSVAVV